MANELITFNKQCGRNTRDDYTLQFSNSKFGGLLTATTEVTVTAPSGQGEGSSPFAKKQVMAVIKATPGKTVWVSVNATATVPSTSGAINEEMIEPKMCRAVFEGDVLHFITGDTGAFYGVVFYALD